MMPASKHGDPQLGIDIHLCIVPPSPSPVPLPTPHMSIVFDPFDYIPIIGGTITVCGMKRATAGTNAIVVHIPPGFPFAPKLPDKDDELFMGSSTVVADGDPFSYIALPVLGCQVAGIFSPPRLKKKNKNMMLLPTTFNLAIPTTVFVGGPPTISLMGMAFKGLFAGLGKLAKSGLFKRMRQKLFKNMNPGFLKCKILRAEPVNILTGEVSVEQEDFSLPGRIPLQWVRTYSSGNRHDGLCGPGWETPADARLEINGVDGSVQMHYPLVGPLFFEELPAAPGKAAAVLELMDGALLYDHGHEFQVRTKDDRVYHFRKDLAASSAEGHREIPLGRVSDLCGNWLEFERGGGRLTGIQESAGRRIGIHLTKDHAIEIALNDAATDTRHVFVRYEKDAAGDLATVIDALGNPYRFAYDEHHMVRHTDRKGLSFYYEYDKQAADEWRVVHAWGDGNLYNYRFQYADALNERRITDSLGHVSLVKLDERGLPISEIDPLGGMTIFEYDDAGRTTAVTDPGGRRTGYEYDDRGNLLTLTRPDDKTILTEFSAANKAVSITDPNGAQWLQKWDERGLLIEQISPLGNVSRYDYDSGGQLIALINPRGARTEFAFDGVGNLAGIKDALGHLTVFGYDALGKLIAKRDVLKRQTDYVYDAKGRLLKATLPGGNCIRCEYDSEDQLTRYCDENGSVTELKYVGTGRLAERSQPDGHGVRYCYDTEEQLSSVVNQGGKTYRFIRDALGRVIEEIDYWGQSRRYDYDASGHITRSIDPLGRIVIFNTDALGRIVKKTLPNFDDPRSQTIESFAYNPAGQLVEMRNAVSHVKRHFDGEGRLREELQNGFKVENEYDEVGNRTQRRTSTGNTVVVEYNAGDQPTRISINDETPITIERNALGQATVERLSPHLMRMLRYDADGLLTAQAAMKDGVSLFNTQFEYDNSGNVTSRIDSDYGVDRYTYDPMGRIQSHIDPAGKVAKYLNDPSDERLKTRIYDATMKRVMGGQEHSTVWTREGECDGLHCVFDRAGNLVSRSHTDEKSESVLRLDWDANQRLGRSYWEHGDRRSQVTNYGYDPLGRRVFKRNSAETTLFFWDGDALLCELTQEIDGAQSAIEGKVVDLFAARDQANAFKRQHSEAREYVYRPATFEPLALIDREAARKLQVKAANGVQSISGQSRIPMSQPTPKVPLDHTDLVGTVFFYHNDVNGCPRRLSDCNGRVVWSMRYAVWGRAVAADDNVVESLIRLQGQYEDVETGLHYNRHRYFDPDVGQFVAQDVLGLAAGLNLYWYGMNTLRWSDPLGLMGGIIDNKFPSEDLPHDGKIIPHSVQDGKIKLDVPGQREFDFVVTTDNRLVIGKRHHLLGDRSDVLAAGQMKISGDGRVTRIDNLSGHYRPTVLEAEGFADALKKAGVNPTGATLNIHDIMVDADGNVLGTRRVKSCKL
jgi:RHS repeat-associated protein